MGSQLPHLALIVIFGCILSPAAALDEYNGCSFHQYYTCHHQADCRDLPDGRWECYCDSAKGLSGDGLKGANNTGCIPTVYTCRFQDDCHKLATCNELAVCACKQGYTGDGKNICNDVNECSANPCNKNARCENTQGSFICTCNAGFIGNGATCTYTCNTDADCHQYGKCFGGLCRCAIGFSGDGKDSCNDIDECATDGNNCNINAVCINTEGSFSCVCKPGYQGDGKTCTLYPKNCHELLMAKSYSKSGIYELDLDGTGPLLPIKIQCEMQPGLGVTIISPIVKDAVRYTITRTVVKDYEHPKEYITQLISSSSFCYQNIAYKCAGGAILLDGNDYWIDGKGQKQENWGGATESKKCACGQLGYCANIKSPCNCNGTIQTMVDDGKIFDKNILPVQSVTSGTSGRGYGLVTVGDLRCAPIPFDIPRDCDDAKFNLKYKILQDGPQVLDFDGPKGPLQPVMTHCDMETYAHVGITVIPTTVTMLTNVTTNGTKPITYLVDNDHVKSLVAISPFCMQEAGYTCQNSRLLNNGDMKGYFSTINGTARNYWPGGQGVDNMCGCGLIGACDSPSALCNCDIADGVERTDFGVITNKADLPIGSVTFLEVGSGRTSMYYAGPLRCAKKEFGYEATCQAYFLQDRRQSYMYLIDPDGPVVSDTPDPTNVAPFPAHCEMATNPPYGITIIHHRNETQTMQITVNGVIVLEYRSVFEKQLLKLRDRSIYCTQAVEYNCIKAPLHSETGQPVMTWKTFDGAEKSYFEGTGVQGNICHCKLNGGCSNTSQNCSCDLNDLTMRTDAGSIVNKQDLPIMTLNFTNIGSQSSAEIKIGPMKCYEIFPSCSKLKIFYWYKRLPHESIVPDGDYTIDPDGPGGVPPFMVTCDATVSILYIKPGDNTNTTQGQTSSPVTTCFNVTYQNNKGPVTPQQVQALIASSPYCTQQLVETCTYAPLSNHSKYYSCDGQLQPGWPGSRGMDSCSCGVTGTCAGGPQSKCNCDMEDNIQRQDGDWIHDRSRLAVCKICITLDPVSPGSSIPIRKAGYSLTDLHCNDWKIGMSTSCQEKRNGGMTESGTMQIDPDWYDPVQPSPVYCGLSVVPPVGWAEIRPVTDEVIVPPSGITHIIKYYVYEMAFMTSLILKSKYCEQEIYLLCNNGNLVIAGSVGLYSKSGKVLPYWAGNTGGKGCKNGLCNCQLPGEQSDGGVIADKNVLPITKIILGQGAGKRVLKIGPVKCYNLYRNCEEIRSNNAMTNPLRNNVYAIDPDMGGGVPYFGVVCDFKTQTGIGITFIEILKPPTYQVINAIGPGDFKVPLAYRNVTYDQVHALTTISQYCYQGIQFLCKDTPLINGNNPAYGFYNTYSGEASSSFGTGYYSNAVGCACVVTGTCPENGTCHCDVDGPMFNHDYGYITDTSILPLTKLNFGGQNSEDDFALFHVTDIRCGPTPFDLPKDCEEALARGTSSGEVLIWPSRNVRPFLVSCDIYIFPGHGVTVIGNNLEDSTPISGQSYIPVNYNNATIEQVDALTDVSIFCFQPIKYDCISTRFISYNTFHWTGGNNINPMTYLGSGRPWENECNCGVMGLCGGSEDRETLMNLTRKCNCDAGDALWRADAGIINSTKDLPISALSFGEYTLPGGSGKITLGKLYCANDTFDLNECQLGFHDCHELAQCTNTYGSFECRCKPGYRGYGVPGVWANGRNCYDDDECALKHCPYSADCTNTPGSFYCTCKKGYRTTGPQSCQDIDECAEGTDNCDENAQCVNLDGSFYCRCNRGFRFDGQKCTPLGMCACFGDPHCLTMDNRLMHFQGLCQYTMARDGCNGSQPTFEVITQNWQKELVGVTEASWVKNITFNIAGHKIELMQGKEVRVDGIKIIIPFITREDRGAIYIRLAGKYVEVYARYLNGIQLNWDGEQNVELYVPGSYKEKICGLCGNYNDNPADDWMVGPACPAKQGTITDNLNLFGNSWTVIGKINSEPNCIVSCAPNNDTGLCEGHDRKLAEYYCDLLLNKNGFFKECLEAMPEALYDKYRLSCIYDLCHVGQDMMQESCNTGEALLQDCKINYGIIVDLRKEGFCGITCGENMEYFKCYNMSSQRTCTEMVSAESLPVFYESCSEGCFCKEGYVLDGNRCVLPHQCGCLYGGNYYSVGEVIYTDNCTEKRTCLANRTFDVKPVTCHENAFCGLREGVYRCHCQNGYYGDGEQTCIVNPCLSNPCNRTETCVLDITQVSGYTCQCLMGYTSDCGHCQDIDECASNTDNCPLNAKCTNLDGSFRCDCNENYTSSSKRCVDIDECSVGIYKCGNNSKCVNNIGGYSCVCCNGFAKNSKGECVETNSDVANSGPKCCVCVTYDCQRPGKVCDEDGVTHNSFRDMVISRCEQNKEEEKAVDYFGKCEASCANVKCPKYQTCTLNKKTGKPTCECESCTTQEMQSSSVCTTNLDEYSNMCLFKKVMCQFDSETVLLNSTTPCEEKAAGSPVGPWGEWGPCSVTCGNGLKTRTRPEYRQMSVEEKKLYPSEITANCYQDPCPDSPCFGNSCRTAEICVDVNGTAVCKCPSCENEGVEPVCGYIHGDDPGTWQSACVLRLFACLKKKPYELLQNGECGEKPVNCSRVPRNDYVKVGNCVSKEKINLGACDGGCGSMKEFCCRKAASQTRSIELICPDQSITKTMAEFIEDCECVPLQPGEQMTEES
ncbi:hypothetical protein CHS0354_020807 [Potamilus streckersoni]|uniref:Uncharacterized protein n=1 Tax=Potamilus streckersoni TaxID=2493646 RepID=A0AAE0VIC5_9BIVA|nr:hypothetical protein CHS0354_020807 [Potamilus streckersoni]